MRTLFIGFLVFLAWLLFCRWHYVCQVRNMCGGEKIEQLAPKEDNRDKTLNFVDKGKTILEGYDQFKFNDGASSPQLNANNEKYIDEVAKYLKENPDAKITVTGNYLKSEAKTDADGNPVAYGFFENLGVARADAIRQLLVKEGIDEGRINLDYNLVDDSEGDVDLKPITLKGQSPAVADNNEGNNDGESDVSDKGGTPEGYSNEGQQFSFTNMSFSDANFAYNSDKFNPGAAFKSYADSVVTYLKQEPNKSLVLVGHTCSKGTDEYNLRLGKKRAESVKRYFRNKGVDAKITTQSEGESNPAYPNTTEASRSKNRRVVVKIK